MHEYIFILIFLCVLSVFSQILLKKAALNKYSSVLRQYLNVYVFLGYFLFVLILIANAWLLRFFQLSTLSAVSESLPLVLSIIAGRLFFEERISIPQIIGCFLIVLGILVVLL